ncbi:MAG: UDP-N-acetylglucosamine 2-epimerase (non-hydrolyzing) [Bacteroidetes bacterium]|nr:UDP-N-acetylglucosamine 2-epimerase (non-hydrolyzing) [Bacteroidota bacterium]
MANKKILVVVGTRPNFIKVTQFKRVAQQKNSELKIVHTGQHFDDKMADVFFRQFNLVPDFFLNIPQNLSREELIQTISKELIQLMQTQFKPDLLVVVGDVNSTLAGALAGKSLNIKLAHVESGLRSNDLTMPEEINRIETDKITDYFFVTEQSGLDNLKADGVKSENIFFVGNTMIDTMVAFKNEIEASPVLEDLNLKSKAFVLMTMHRPATVDSKEGLDKLLQILKEVNKTYKILFPVHPRTTKNIELHGLKKDFESLSGLIFTPPLDYFAFQKLIKHSKFILTDSGGIQEESTFVQIPCLTLRPNTERPVTCTIGTNTLIPFDVQVVLEYINTIEKGTYKKGDIPPLWDGKATERIFEAISKL